MEGKLKHRTYDDQQGNKRYVTEVVANEFLMLGKKGETQEQSAEAQSAVPSDNLPF